MTSYDLYGTLKQTLFLLCHKVNKLSQGQSLDLRNQEEEKEETEVVVYCHNVIDSFTCILYVIYAVPT